MLNAEADPRLLEIVRELDHAERHLRAMVAPPEPMVSPSAARWAKRCLDALTEVCRVATEAEDDAFPLHLEAIRRGRKKPPLPMRWQVWMAWKWASLKRPPMTDKEFNQFIENGFIERPAYTPTAGEVAACVGDSDKRAELSVRDCTNHLKALGLPYAPAQRGRRKSI
jgi:hypothetical protein